MRNSVRRPRPGEIIGWRRDGRPIRLAAGGDPTTDTAITNPYLVNLRQQYDNLTRVIEGIQNRASAEGRQCTPEEMRSIGNMNTQQEALRAEIDVISAVELRNAEQRRQAAEVDAAMRGNGHGGGFGGGVPGGVPAGAGVPQGGAPLGGQAGGAMTADRDPGHYRRAGGSHSFLADVYLRDTQGNIEAAQRLASVTQHVRAALDNPQTTQLIQLRDVLGAGATTAGAGLVPPVWLASQFAPILHKRLRVALQLRQVPWAGPFAWTIPIAVTGAQTSSTAEGVNTTETDPTYQTVTVTPKAIMGYSEISRQMLEASNPAVDAIVWGDMVGNFYDNVEIEVVAHLNGLSGVNTVTVSAGAATTSDILLQRTGLLNGIAAISDNNAGDATFIAGRNSRWITYLLMQDTTGRPLISAQRYSPQNALGLGDANSNFARAIQGELEGQPFVTSPSIAASTGFIGNGDEVLFSVSPPLQFRFDEPAGPALIRIGVWGYEAVSGARRPKAITKVTYSGS